jgi:hypothetical protein
MHDVEAVECRLHGNFVGLSGEAEAVSVMSRVKCLAILRLSRTAPISRPISALPRIGWRLRATAAASNGFGGVMTMPEGVLIADRGAATGCPPCFGAR